MKTVMIMALLCANTLTLSAQEKPYQAVAQERASKIVDNLKDELTAAQLRKTEKLITAQYVDLHAIHEKRDRQIAANEQAKEQATSAADAAVDKLHDRFISKLSKSLNAGQIEEVKNGMTYHTVPLTYNNYKLMLPYATDEELQMIADNLNEAREKAMDAGSAKEKHAWFNKYKGRIANALAANGYDLKKEGDDWAKRRALESAALPIQESNRIIETLSLSEAWQKEQLRNLIAHQYQKLEEIYAVKKQQTADMEAANLDKKAKDAAGETIWQESMAALKAQRDRFYEKLALLIDTAGIERVKNEMTAQGMTKEYQRFNELLPDLTEEHKAQVLVYLQEARDNAINVLTSRERNQWFAKYRGRANNYLSKEGYDLRKATERLEALQPQN